MSNVRVGRRFQFDDADEYALAKAPGREVADETFQHVRPRRRCGCEVHVEFRVLVQRRGTRPKVARSRAHAPVRGRGGLFVQRSLDDARFDLGVSLDVRPERAQDASRLLYIAAGSSAIGVNFRSITIRDTDDVGGFVPSDLLRVLMPPAGAES